MRTFVSLIILAVVLWFAISNAGTVTLHLILWDVQSSLALVVGTAFALGYLLGILRLAPGFWRYYSSARSSKQALADTEKERDQLAERSKTLKQQVEQLAPFEEKK